MHRKPYPIVVWDSREKRKAPVKVFTSITHGVWLEGGLNSGGREEEHMILGLDKVLSGLLYKAKVSFICLF